MIDPFNISDDLLKIAASSERLIGRIRCAVKGNPERMKAILDQALDHFLGGAIEIGAIVSGQSDLLFKSIPHDFRQIGIKEHFAPIRQLDLLNPGIPVHEFFEVLEAKKTPSDTPCLV